MQAVKDMVKDMSKSWNKTFGHAEEQIAKPSEVEKGPKPGGSKKSKAESQIKRSGSSVAKKPKSSKLVHEKVKR